MQVVMVSHKSNFILRVAKNKYATERISKYVHEYTQMSGVMKWNNNKKFSS